MNGPHLMSPFQSLCPISGHPTAPVPANGHSTTTACACAGPQTASPSEVRQAQASDQAMVPAPHLPQEEEPVRASSPVSRLPVELDVSIPVRDFRVRSLLGLTPGQLVETQWAHGEDLPLAAGKVQLAWSEFEVIDTDLAVRITRLV